MALNSVSSEEFSFQSLPSHVSSHHSGLDSPPLWKHSPENSHRKDYDFGFSRLLIGKDDGNSDQTKSFSYVEKRSRWSDDKAEEKMDMLWEDFNEELPPRSQSMRIDPGDDGGQKKPKLFPEDSSAVTVGCGMKLSRNTPKKKKSPNVLVLMRLFKKLIVLRSSSRRSPAKTHPR